ncbi:MAG: hypothetical protein J6T15_07450 [Bacilli bacterium]|nr:hypothetical protein [Bacilli bacterium]
MPHVGGGGHFSGGGGSFHSFGGNSSSSSAPRYDKHGRLHSTYYTRPGYYYHSHYIPYTYAERRGIQNFAASIFLFITAIVLVFFAVHTCSLKGEFDQEKLENYGLETYAEIYDEKSQYYESNVLVTIVDYKDNNSFDYVCINGDNVYWHVDMVFGGPNSSFGSEIKTNIPRRNYRDDIYLSLSKCVNNVVDTQFDVSDAVKKYFGVTKPDNVKNSKIINRTPYEITNGKSQLQESIDRFYDKTHCNLTFVIDTNENVYTIDWGLFGLLIAGTTICVVAGILLIIQKRHMIQIIEEEIANGNAEKYFEGEDTFEEYCKEHPLDDETDSFEKYASNTDSFEDY